MSFKFFIFLFFFLSNLQGVQAVDYLNDKIIDEYLKIQNEFNAISCKNTSVEEFQKLDKSYKGDGNFIPVLLDEKIDLKTIKNLIPLMREKQAWIEGHIENLSKLQDFKSELNLIKEIEKDQNGLLILKKDDYFASDASKKSLIEKKAAEKFEKILKNLQILKDRIPFLLSFKFPVNHLALRSEYDKYKNSNTKEGRAKSNSIYLFRKVVQDGTYDEELVKNDSTIRSAFDTLYLSLTKDTGRIFLTDIERVDLIFVLNNFEKLLSYRALALKNRLIEWRNRNERSIQFYEDLLEGKKIKLSEESQIKDVTSLLEDRAKSLYTLKEFVLTREAKTYEFWSQKSELMQALFAIETILYSEVGRIDAPDALERKDVAQVVINRSDNPIYNQLGEKDTIRKFLSPTMKLDGTNKWLNVLFKEGEFSFTYFYIPGNVYIYCPDMSKMGQYLRRENIRIALELLNKGKTSTEALRYFSRTSMFGRIEMNSLWNDFHALPESPGAVVSNAKSIYKQFKKDNYTFLYEFSNEALKKNFLVIEFKGRNYVLDKSDPHHVYHYRNPHQFKYFAR